MQNPEHRFRSFDWHKLKAEFFSTSTSLNKLREKYEITPGHFFKMTKGWRAEKEALQKKAMKNLEIEVVDYYQDYISRSRKFLDNMLKHFEHLVSIGQLIDDKKSVTVQSAIPPDLLLDIAKAFAENLKAVRLIEGKSTENKAVAVAAEGDLHKALMQIMHEVEGADNPEDSKNA